MDSEQGIKHYIVIGESDKNPFGCKFTENTHFKHEMRNSYNFDLTQSVDRKWSLSPIYLNK